LTAVIVFKAYSQYLSTSSEIVITVQLINEKTSIVQTLDKKTKKKLNQNL